MHLFLSSPLIVLALLGAAPSSPTSPPKETQLKSDEAQWQDGKIHAEGNVRVRSDGRLLGADRADYDTEAKCGTAEGRVTLIDGPAVVRAQSGSFSTLQGTLELHEVELFQKAGPSPTERYLGLSNQELAREGGRNTLTVKAERLERREGGGYQAQRVRLTPCDCRGETPDYEIGAEEADIILNERAILTWPVFYIHDVPVMTLPYLYLPLSHRQTGFLIPKMGFASFNGFYLRESFFWALGESYDLTLTPGYWFGTSKDYGMRGPRFDPDFRYAPTDRTLGELGLNLTRDLHHDKWRGDLFWNHATVGGTGLEVGANVGLVSDDQLPVALQQTGLLTRFTRSAVRAAWKGDETSVGVGGLYYQPLPGLYDSGTVTGALSPGRSDWLRRPAMGYFALPSTLLTPSLRGSFDGSVTQFEHFSLLDLNPRATYALAEGVVDAETFSSGHLFGTTEDGMGAKGMVGVRASSTFARVFGTGTSAFRHAIIPAVELRGVSGTLGTPIARDSLDLSEYGIGAQQRADLQGVASLTSTLAPREGNGRLKLQIGQMASLKTGKLSDTFGLLEGRLGMLSASFTGRHDLESGDELLTALGRAEFSKGNFLSARYDQTLGVQGTGLMRSGFDQLFGTTAQAYRLPETVDSDYAFRQLTVGVGLRPAYWVGLEYNLGVTLADPQHLLPGWRKLNSHTGRLYFTSRCDCWNIALTGSYYVAPVGAPQGNPAIGFSLDLKGL